MTHNMPFHSSLPVTTVLACVLLLAGWRGAAWCQNRTANTTTYRLTWIAIRLGLAWAFWFMLLRVVSATLETVGTWPHWFLALSAAVVSELVLQGYSQRSTEAKRSTREKLADLGMPVLRVAMTGLLIILLLEPIVSHQEVHEDERIVAILLDESDSMKLSSRSVSDGGLTRHEVAERLLSGGDAPRNGLLNKLMGDYQVRLYSFAATARQTDPAHWLKQVTDRARPTANERWTASTELANALQQLDGDLPLDALSGVIILTDGCDHSTTEPWQASHRLIQQKIPISSLVIGSQIPVRDAQVITVQTPPQIFLGDSVAVRATLKIDQSQGQTVKVKLLKDGQPVEEKSIPIPSNRHRESVMFKHQPSDVGVHQYSVRIDALPDEENRTNNTVDQYVTVSKDHIHLLVIDERPRWEYRYLRNLFSGRDRTVYLQSVLLQPDRLAGVPDPPIMHASALRAFDDCDATALPEALEDWLKFDAIVLGDISPERLGDKGVRAIETFVKNRGGSLIVIAGQNHMPHTYVKSPLADLFPVRLNRNFDPSMKSPDANFYFTATRDAGSQVMLQQVGAGMDSLAWAFPSLSWRHPACEAKTGATVLSYASQERLGPHEVPTMTQEQQRQNSLMLWQRFGAGKVLQMTFDQSWRLRFGVGDKFHHDFWGQLIRWAVKDRLSVGTDLVRMGTDRIQYHTGDIITVRARLTDLQRNAVNADTVQIVLYDGDKIVQQVPLMVQPDSGGVYQAEIRDLKKSGKYRLELAGVVIDQLLAQEKKADRKVGTDIVVQSQSDSRESADLVADVTVPTQLADASGGKVVTPENIEELLQTLGPKSNFQRERWTVPLWNQWPVMLVFLACINLEWILRRSRGLL